MQNQSQELNANEGASKELSVCMDCRKEEASVENAMMITSRHKNTRHYDYMYTADVKEIQRPHMHRSNAQPPCPFARSHSREYPNKRMSKFVFAVMFNSIVLASFTGLGVHTLEE